ncbi:hypothetical protein TNCV_1077581 [Trichonephila clavipes]|uniref:Uncharacterized protein n=1 Tax=Trichonephila clavipes TaxID=2585209 RepID=A0A8X6RQW5_TRICX|nr:hypothetical protein TNCV_1077581 [Trichonephila clavipes]
MIQQSTMDIASRPHKQSNINKQLKFLCAEVAQTKLEPTDPKQKAFDRAKFISSTRTITGNSRSRSLVTPDYFFRPLHQFVEDMLSGDVQVWKGTGFVNKWVSIAPSFLLLLVRRTVNTSHWWRGDWQRKNRTLVWKKTRLTVKIRSEVNRKERILLSQGVPEVQVYPLGAWEVLPQEPGHAGLSLIGSPSLDRFSF